MDRKSGVLSSYERSNGGGSLPPYSRNNIKNNHTDKISRVVEPEQHAQYEQNSVGGYILNRNTYTKGKYLLPILDNNNRINQQSLQQQQEPLNTHTHTHPISSNSGYTHTHTHNVQTHEVQWICINNRMISR
eukprot:GHVR01087273.1.p1 GENE.GHVR01087273.1~~GHVR01087273.1.p1  ORF type:complete len:132 (-),score=65.75 GHVR01087273.1:53-448(-)